PELKLIGKYSNLKILKNRNYAKYSFNEQYRLFENIISSRNINQPLGLSLDSLTRINQKIINPYKTGLGIKMLSQTLNKEIIDNSIKEYFKRNNLKNNTPVTFQEIIERNSRNNSSWFFNDFLKRKSFKDFTIKKIYESNKLTYFKLSNYYNSNSPIQLSLLKDNKILKEDWIIIKEKDTIISYESNLYDFIEINKNKYITERNYKNNLASFKNYKKPFKLILFNDFESTYNKQLNYIPLLGYNLYDGLMPGITLTNITLIKKPFSYKIKPFYSSKQKKILGSMNLKYTKYNENKKLFSTQYFISGSTFHYKENLSYTSLFPSITLTFRNSDLRSNFRQFLNLRYISIYREENIDQQKYPNYNIFNAKYILTNSNGGKGFTLNSDLQISKSFVKTSFTGMYRNYYKDNRQYNFRLFIGKFLYNSTDDDYFSFSTYRARDYMFNYNLLGRSETTGFYSQQFISSEGALKSMINPAYSNDWLISVNSGITLWQWIEGYYDLAFIKNKNKNIQTAYDSGIRLNILTDYFELYFPFYSSLGNELKHSNYSDKIRFKITFDPNTVSGLFTRRWF
ncbi:MAG: metalloprotease, partial [Flavobacteriaceae bacterium]|nr:metalloprotease [Flavobacteriaceae bacterium]